LERLANRWWPSVYLVDKRGYVRYWWCGEMNWKGAKGEEFMRLKIGREIPGNLSEPTAISASATNPSTSRPGIRQIWRTPGPISTFQTMPLRQT
jgi:hypothetical protein